jgi:ABC-type uncharacterized transport system permease subunit
MEMLLSPVQEAVLAKFMKVMGQRGIPLTLAALSQYACEISGRTVGSSWPK